MRPRRGLLAVGFLLMAINRVSGLVLPYSTKFLIDTVIAKHHAERLRPLVILVLCATIIQGLFFFSETPTPAIYTLSLHDALPISDKKYGTLTAGNSSPLTDGASALILMS